MSETLVVERPAKKTNWTLIILVILLVILIGASGYLFWTIQQMDRSISALTEERDALTVLQNETQQLLLEASTTVAVLQGELNLTAEELAELEDDYRDERRKNEDFENQIDDLSDTLSDLDKLSKIDEELLQKYSRVYFLNENYVPDRLREIDEEYVQDDREPEFFLRSAMPFLEDLLEEADDDDIDITVISAYRSFDEQSELKEQHTQVFGSGANAFSADQGYSEHQLGTTVDFGTSDIRSAQTAFAQTEAYEWLLDNAHKYGFVLSYPEGNQYYIFEPWHWRFVGVDLARDLKRDDANFYDWDQRKINEYLIKIFD